MLKGILNTTGILNFVSGMIPDNRITNGELKELEKLLLNNDKLKTEFITMVFTYNTSSLFTEMLNIMADNNIVSSSKAKYNNTGEHKV